MIDFRALCAELAYELDAETGYIRNDGTRITHPTVAEARAALTQPEPQGPTDEELVELFNENDWNYISPETFLDIARSVLELR